MTGANPEHIMAAAEWLPKRLDTETWRTAAEWSREQVFWSDGNGWLPPCAHLAALELLVRAGVAEGGTDEFGARVFRRRQT